MRVIPIFVLLLLVISAWILIEPVPLFFEIHNILPNQSFAAGPLINPFLSIFSLEGIATLHCDDA